MKKAGRLDGRALKRVEKEIEKMRKEGETDHSITVEVISSDTWHVHMIGAPETIYEGEAYCLQVKFNNDYPIDSPEIIFIGTAPVSLILSYQTPYILNNLDNRNQSGTSTHLFERPHLLEYIIRGMEPGSDCTICVPFNIIDAF